MESTSSEIKRKLAAIMFTDIVGYTAMMHENETAAATMRRRHRKVFQKEHQRRHGEVLQYYGDGTLSIFDSAVEAVECAITMQQIFQSDKDIPVPLRIGIHLGDIVFSDDEVYGDGVNQASRVESMGVPGCILISEKLNYAVKNQTSISARSVGYFEFKNIKDPVEVFAITNAGIKVPERSELKGKLKENKKSIAVLPFVNMSSDPENEYFSDGISEEILNVLVKIEGLQVTARTSSFMFKGKNQDVREIGTQLGVAHILEGSVRKAGNRVRITAQLVSCVDGYHLFSESYDRTLEDIFAVQDEIAQKITNRLREHLGEAEHQKQLVKAPTMNMKAYETYLQGLYYFNQWEDEAFGKAIPFFEKAFEMQPDFGLPHARLTICYMFLAMGGVLTWDEAHKKAIVHIEQTRQLGIETAEVYFGESVFEIFFRWDWAAAVKAIKKGLELFPNYSSLYHALSTIHYIQNDEKALVESQKKGLELDPLSLEMIFFMGVAYLWTRDFGRALPYFDKVLELVPNHRTAWECKGWVAAFQKQYEEALGIFKNLEPAIGFRYHRSTCMGWVYLKQGKKEKAAACIQELKQLEKHSTNFAPDLASLYTCAGDFDQAFHYLEKTIRNKVGDSMMFRSDIFLAPLREDPRFKDMETLVGEVPEIDF